jgi:hypothetical protein
VSGAAAPPILEKEGGGWFVVGAVTLSAVLEFEEEVKKDAALSLLRTSHLWHFPT